MTVHNHPPYRPACNERMVNGRLRGACLTDDGQPYGSAYVAGFLIDPENESIVLVRKAKPEWQAGRLNGVGGKIERGETAAEAMAREFEEEAGARIETWDHFATVSGDWGSVAFFRAVGNSLIVRTVEDEQIEVWRLDSIPWADCLPNLSWLIPLALYAHDTYEPVTAREVTAWPSLARAAPSRGATGASTRAAYPQVRTHLLIESESLETGRPRLVTGA